ARGSLRVAAHVDRDEPLHRLREALRVLESTELALERALVLTPERAQRLDVLVGTGASAFPRDPEGVELLPQPAHTHAELHAPAGEHVERRELLGEDDGIALRKDEDAGGETERGGRGAHP